MSLATWKAEFYPVEAQHVPKKDAIAHSLRKWRGLTEENLKKHGLVRLVWIIEDQEQGEQEQGEKLFLIDGNSCSLCVHYQHGDRQPCTSCPLFIHIGNRCDDGNKSPYSAFWRTSNPHPMIQALEATAEKFGGAK